MGKMGKFLAGLCLALGIAASSGATTLTGIARDAQGNTLTINGSIWFTISQAANVNSGGCGGPFQIGPGTPAVFTLTNGTIAGGASVVGNDCITPANTFYREVIITSDGQVAVTRNVLITGGSADIGSLAAPATGGGTGGSVPTSRAINTTAPLSGGGDLTSDRTLSLAISPGGAGTAVGTTRNLFTTAPVTGGGTLTADLTFGVSLFSSSTSGIVPASGGGTANFLRADGTWSGVPGGVSTARQILTTAPLTGGGDLSADRTIALPISPGGATTAVGTTRSLATTAPLTGGGDLSGDRTLAVSTFGTGNSGVVPSSGGGTSNFLRADGTWAAPGGALSAYSTVQQGGSGITQRNILNFGSGLSAVDNAGATRSDVALGSLTADWNPGNFNVTARNTTGVFNVKAYGAKGDWNHTGGTASIANGSSTLTVSVATFASTDVGKKVLVPGAGAAGTPLITTISGFTSSTVVTLTLAASTTVSGVNGASYGTDDTAAIAAAITASNSAGGYVLSGTVYMPRGQYVVSSVLVLAQGNHLQGEGQFVTQLIPFANSSATHVLRIDGIDVDVSNLGIYNNASLPTPGDGIVVNGTTDAHIRHVWVSGLNYGVRCQASAYTVMDDVSVEQSVLDGFYLVNTRGSRIINSTAFFNRNGVYMFNNGAVPTGNIIEGSHFVENSRNGVLLFGGNNDVISSNDFSDNSIGGPDRTYDHIALTGSGGGGETWNVRVVGNVSHVEIGGTKTRYGISLDANVFNSMIFANALGTTAFSGPIYVGVTPLTNNNTILDQSLYQIPVGRGADAVGSGSPGNNVWYWDRSAAGGLTQQVYRSSVASPRFSLSFDATADTFYIGNASQQVLTVDQNQTIAAGVAGLPANFAVRRSDVALVNGLNSNIAIGSAGFTRWTGPTGAYSVGGFVNGSDGRILRVFGAVAQTQTIVNEDVSSTAANRITTLTGANVVLRAGATSFATFIYDSASSRWILTGTN